MRSWIELTTSERVELVREVYAKGDSTASRIADRVSRKVRHTVTRNSIVNVYRRNPGLKNSHPLTGAFKQKPPLKKAKPVAPKLLATEESPGPEKPAEHTAYDATAKRIGLLKLKGRQCRYVVGENPYVFCGHETPKGSSWCPHHRERVYKAKDELPKKDSGA